MLKIRDIREEDREIFFEMAKDLPVTMRFHRSILRILLGSVCGAGSIPEP